MLIVYNLKFMTQSVYLFASVPPSFKDFTQRTQRIRECEEITKSGISLSLFLIRVPAADSVPAVVGNFS